MRIGLTPLMLALPLLLVPPALAQAQPAKDLETGVQDLAGQLAQGMAGQVKKLAVVEFPDLNGYQSTLGQFIAEELITQLSVSKTPSQFDVVERRLLARVLKEQELTDSSLFDAESITKIGKILGIEAIVTGSIADLGSEVKINARAISVETAKVFAAASVKIPKDDVVQQLMRQNAGSLQGSGGAPARAGAPPRVAQRSDLYFQNDFLRVELSSAALSKAKTRLTLSLVFENTSGQEILLAMAADYYSACVARVVDNSGVAVPNSTGSSAMVTGLRCLWSDSREKAENYARLSPGAKTPIVLAFETQEKEPFSGDLVSFSAELLRLSGDQYSRFTVGLAGIEVRN
jgi:TolB-like protein